MRRLPFKLPSFAFYHRLNPRERVLLLAVAGTVVFVVNLILLTFLIRTSRDLGLAYTAKSQELQREAVFADQKNALWVPRNEWLKKTQPVLTNQQVETSKLQTTVEALARGSAVIPTNPKLLTPTGSTPGKPSGGKADYQAVSLHIDTQSDWKGIVKFLASLQKPDAFLVLDSASLHTEPADPTKMRGEFLISKWFAPAVPVK